MEVLFLSVQMFRDPRSSFCISVCKKINNVGHLSQCLGVFRIQVKYGAKLNIFGVQKHSSSKAKI